MSDKKRVLLVDDEPDFLSVLRRVLRPQEDRWDMTFVLSVDEALDSVSQAKSLDRRKIRDVAEQRWAKERMVRDYIRVYERVLELHGRRRA